MGRGGGGGEGAIDLSFVEADLRHLLNVSALQAALLGAITVDEEDVAGAVERDKALFVKCADGLFEHLLANFERGIDVTGRTFIRQWEKTIVHHR